MLDDAINYLLEIRNNPTDFVKEVIQDNSDMIIQFNIDTLMSGEYIEGGDVTPPYSPFTVRLKKLKGQPHKYVTWKDTGKLHKNIKINYNKNSFKIVSTVKYFSKLTKKYGERLGLDDIRLDILREKAASTLVDNMLDKL